ncbi:MAG: HAD-IA family hydrolase [Azospirillum sp.]|nr:HAD-IA family hydrolase [Azospirillum sp.]
MPFSLALFDCDGTLVDSQHIIVAAMTAAWRDAGLTDPEPAAVRRVVGLSLVEAVAALLPEAAGGDHERLAACYRRAFFELRQNADHEEPLFPGIRETLSALAEAGILLGIATGKSRRGLVALLRRLDLLESFVTLQTADDGPGKPDPTMVRHALAAAGVGAAAAVMIGDTTYDIEMARRAGLASVGVAWGYHEPAELAAAGADRIAGTAGELPDLIKALLSGGRGLPVR